jgi:uncharacterized repeat protein (TIGR03803 family)
MNNSTLHRSCILGRMIFGTLALAVFSGLFLCAARSAQAQTETVLYNFTGGSDGGGPRSSLTSDGAGNLYGTTYAGGASGAGTVFELSPNGQGGWNETVLYNFCSALNCSDGGYTASYVLFDASGNLYGTAYNGGAYLYGVVFELSPRAGGWTESVLYNFTGGSDAGPTNGLIMDSAGNLYGLTNPAIGYGGGAGTVFELSPSGGGWTKQDIYTVDNAYGALTMDGSGNIFGTTLANVFELSPNGNGGWNTAVIHTFAGAPKDGNDPYAGVVLDKAGNVYGATGIGGAKNAGTVYKLSPVTSGKKKGTWKEKILYSFKSNGKDGIAPLKIVFDMAGNIYGTTNGGGKTSDGTVFELVAPVGKGGYKEKVLWSFNGTDGNQPVDGLILDSLGNLYGTTYEGGSANNGVVFEVTP